MPLVTASTFTWLQFDSDQAQRARELVQALSEPGTLDSLGIGAIRDGFADILFPGTSTLHTRARYFLLVPWALEYVAARKPRTADAYDKRLRETERRIIESLVDSNPRGTTGIIGRERRGAVRQPPTVVYWNALAVWGLRSATHLRRAELRQIATSSAADRAGLPPVWDEMPDAPEGFPDAPLSILPTLKEAKYLLEKMMSTRVTPVIAGVDAERTLLALIARHPEQAYADAPWDVDDHILTPFLRNVLPLAEGFSLVIHGARLRYLELLYEQKARLGSNAPNRDRLAALKQDWLAEMHARHDDVDQWAGRLSELFALLRSHGIQIGKTTELFVSEWCRAAAANPGQAMADPRLADAIRHREASLKKSGARLTNSSPLLNWNGELVGSDRLEFRWSYAARHVLDCQLGIEAEDAQP